MTNIDNDKITQEELADRLHLDKTTIAKAVKRLEYRELITRTINQDDQRKKELVATKKAELIDKKMMKHMENHAQTLFEGINDEEINTFIKTLEKIDNNLEKNHIMMNEKRKMQDLRTLHISIN